MSDKWMTIDSAPKDGSEFLAFSDGEYFVAWWYSPDDAFVWILPAELNYSDTAYVMPTHWAYLPPAPKDASHD